MYTRVNLDLLGELLKDGESMWLMANRAAGLGGGCVKWGCSQLCENDIDWKGTILYFFPWRSGLVLRYWPHISIHADSVTLTETVVYGDIASAGARVCLNASSTAPNGSVKRARWSERRPTQAFHEAQHCANAFLLHPNNPAKQIGHIPAWYTRPVLRSLRPPPPPPFFSPSFSHVFLKSWSDCRVSRPTPSLQVCD